MEVRVRMRARIVLFLGIGLALACALRPVGAQAAQSSGMPGPPEELLKMRGAFAAAVAAGVAEAAATLSRFPLDNQVGPGDRTLSRAAFLKRFNDEFTKHKDIVYCWLNGNLEMEYKNGVSNFRKWHLDCNGNVYGFALIGEHWLYTGYKKVNE